MKFCRSRWSVLVATSVLVSACGGGDAASPTTGPAAPDGGGGAGAGDAPGGGGDTAEGGGGSGGDGDGGRAGGGGGEPPGDPLVAPKEEWTWLPVDGMKCGNGSGTGVGVNLTDRSKHVFVYLMGGGACWSEFTCKEVGTSFHIDGE